MFMQELKELLALEYNCSPDDFMNKNNVLTISELKDGRRLYSNEKYFFHMVTMGGNAVITADEKLNDFLKTYINEKQGLWLFEIPNLLPIERELNRYGYTLTQTYHMFLPYTQVEPVKNYPVKWFFDEEIKQFYGDNRFVNAIGSEYNTLRPDRIVVCAYDGNNIMGMAGCSEDTKHWYQVGIDVMPEYRAMGVGTYLITLLKNRIIENGDIPFYGTSVSNYYSWNTALKSGFKPVWVEIGAERINKNM